MQWPTAATVVNRACRELGLTVADVTNPWTATSVVMRQMVALLDAVGSDLARQHSWTQLHRNGSFTSASGIQTYSLPADYLRMVEGTQWDNTANIQWWLATPQETAYIYAVGTVSTQPMAIRVVAGQLALYADPGASVSYAYEYLSRYWVRTDVISWVTLTPYTAGAYVIGASSRVYLCTQSGTSGATTPSGTSTAITDGTCVWQYIKPDEGALTGTAESVTTYTDAVRFDERLLVAGLKLYYLRNKAFDTTAVQLEYDRALQTALGADGMAPTLSVGGRRGRLPTPSVPDTGYGA